MLCAVCLCPEFVAANISDVKVFSGFFIETIVNGENELILDADGKIRLGYLKSCGNNKDSFCFLRSGSLSYLKLLQARYCVHQCRIVLRILRI